MESYEPGIPFTVEEMWCGATNISECLSIPTRLPGYHQTYFLYFSIAFSAAACLSYIIFGKERVL